MTATMKTIPQINNRKSLFGGVTVTHNIYEQQFPGCKGSPDYLVVDVKAMVPFKRVNDYQLQLLQRIEELQKVRAAIDKTTKDIEEEIAQQPQPAIASQTDPRGQPECPQTQPCPQPQPQPAQTRSKPQNTCKQPQPTRQHRLAPQVPKQWAQSLRQHPRLPAPRPQQSRPVTPCEQPRPKTTQHRPEVATRKQQPTTRAAPHPVKAHRRVDPDHEERLQNIEDTLCRLTSVLDAPDYTSVNRSVRGKKMWSRQLDQPREAPGWTPQWTGESPKATKTNPRPHTASPPQRLVTPCTVASPPSTKGKPTKRQWPGVSVPSKTRETAQAPQWATRKPCLDATTYLPAPTRRTSSPFRSANCPTAESRRASLPSQFDQTSPSHTRRAASPTRSAAYAPATTTRRQWSGVSRPGQTRATPQAPQWARKTQQSAPCPSQGPACPSQGPACPSQGPACPSQGPACPSQGPACPSQGPACPPKGPAVPPQPTRANTFTSFAPVRTRSNRVSTAPRSQPGSRTALPVQAASRLICRGPDTTRSKAGVCQTSMALGTIEDIVQTFNTLENAAFDEIRSCGDQKDALNLSMNAIRGK